MNNSWFDKGFDGVGVNDGRFDDIINYFDFQLEDVEVPDDVGSGGGGSGDSGVVKDFNLPFDDVKGKNGIRIGGVDGDGDGDGGDKWDCNFQNLEPPPANVLASLASGFCGDLFGDTLVNNLAISCDNSSQLNHWSSTTKASSSRRATRNGDSADVKGSTWFQSSSPVSVLESSSSCSAPKPAAINPNLSFLGKRDRSKRIRASTFNLQFKLPFISSTSTGSTALVSSESESESNLTEKSAKKRQKKKNLTWLSSSSKINISSSQQPVRKCTHCEITKTPQWREGPKGPKTLCNACGVRYRSGRLFPEYRPAASPTFVPSLHSNSHKKVVEMRKKGEVTECL